MLRPSLSQSSFDNARFGAEIIPFIPALRARALKLSLNAAAADDLVQDTIERALRFGKSYEPGTNLRAWLQQILFTVFVTRCRRGRRERRVLTVLSGDPCAWTVRDEAPSLATLTPKLARLVDDLPPQFAAVVKLVDLQECSYKEAAAELDVPVGTVMSRLFRARRLLAVALSNDVTPAARAA